MKNNLKKTIVILNILAIVFLFSTNSSAQDSPTNLDLGVSENSEIVEGKPQLFTIQLSGNQTARIKAEQTRTDVSLTSYDPSGEKLLEWGLPVGRVGSEELLVIAEVAGEYRIEVTPGNRHRNSGKFIIELTEIRETTEDDRIKNQAAKEISRLMPEAMRIGRLEIASERRKALKIWDEVVRLSKIKEDKTAETRALHTVARLLLDLGEIQKALDLNLQNRKSWRELGNRRFELVATGRIGNIWGQLGEYEKAIAIYQEGAKVSREINSKLNEADSISNIGDSYIAMGQPENAITYYEQALPIYVGLKIPILEASIFSDLGRTYTLFGDYEKGIEYLDKALEIQKKENYLGDLLVSYLHLGKAYKESGDIKQAFEFSSNAESLARELGSKRYLVQAFYQLAILESERGNLEKAIENLENGLKIIEQTRGQLRNEALRTSYFSTVQGFYELYTDLLIERSEKNNDSADIALAFELSERSRSRSLVDLLVAARVDFKQGLDTNLIEKEKDLTDAINAKYQSRERLQNRTPKQEQLEKINAEISKLEIELENLNLQIRRENPKYANLIEGKTLSAKDIQDLLDDKSVLLEYKLGEKRSFLWLVTNDSIDVFELPKREIIEEKAKSFYSLVVANKRQEQANVYKLSKDLGRILLVSVADKIAGKRLIIAADGVLQYSPFSALINPKSFEKNEQLLVETDEIVILPSASVLAQMRENKVTAKQNEKTIAIFADPVFDKNDSRISELSETEIPIKNNNIEGVLRDFKFGETLPRLLASRAEAKNILKFVDKNKVSVLTGFDANINNMENSELSKYGIIHLATHGLLNTSRPELSGLVFSLYDKNGQPQKGFLSLNDIYNLELASDLVVLSACQTALGKDVRGEGLIGISRGFLYAGSNRIVASLWKVDDSATAEFMKLFYKNHLQKKMSASAALRQAKIEMKKIKRYKSPYYWSAFTLLGEWQ